MASGLEALGAASAVLSVISFASQVVSLSYKIYDGMPTPEAELENYAKQMLDAADRVRIRNETVPQGTQAEKRLSEMARECIKAAEELKKETELITKQYKKGKFLKAVHTAIRADKHRANIEELEKSLRMCKEVMEAEVLLQICDKGAAIETQQSKGFQDLESDVKNLIAQLARGQTQLETFVTQEAKATRDVFTTSLIMELKASETKAILESQRERLLRSLKPEEIRERYNQVMSPSDACYERVFASYERVCCKDPEYKAWRNVKKSSHIIVRGVSESEVDEIDRLWKAFCSWLQSNDNIFWIQGKPGSGKSTLIKFIVSNDNTNRLLNSWSPGTRLLSHFFWKIGQESQNSIKGFLCSLLYNILFVETGAIESVLGEFAFSRSKDFYKEWSNQEAEEVLTHLLRKQTRSTCIFIDGLDEISDKDGVPALMSVVERLRRIPRVKVCVSSRPETPIVRRLEAINAQNLRLEDFTRPEMAVYVRKELEKTSGGRIPEPLVEVFIVTLLDKAEGVFLWLALATKSLTNGIENGDNKQILFDRLRELPNELEALYKAMWSRLNVNNKIYRETASMYFRYVIEDGWEVGCSALRGQPRSRVYWHERFSPTLAQLSTAMRIENGRSLLPEVRSGAVAELKALCDMTADDIRTRCAGMLQVSEKSVLDSSDNPQLNFPPEIYPLTRKVYFVHRTAYDFLVDTKFGQEILNYAQGSTPSTDPRINIVKSWFYLLRLYHSVGTTGSIYTAATICRKLLDKAVDQATILELFPVIQDLYEEGIFGEPYMWWDPIPSLNAFLAYQFPEFGDYFVTCFVQPDSPRAATDLLRDIAFESCARPRLSPPVRIVQRLIALGGDAHAVGRPSFLSKMFQKDPSVTPQLSAFELFLRSAMIKILQRDENFSPPFLNIVNIMASTCPDWHRKVVFAPTRERFYLVADLLLSDWWLFAGRSNVTIRESTPWVTFVVDMQFLVIELLAAIDFPKTSTSPHGLEKVAKSFTKPYVRIQHIGPCEFDPSRCYQLPAEEPFKNSIDFLLGPEWVTNTSMRVIFKLLCPPRNRVAVSKVRDLLRRCKTVTLTDEIEYLAREGIGFCWQK